MTGMIGTPKNKHVPPKDEPKRERPKCVICGRPANVFDGSGNSRCFDHAIGLIYPTPTSDTKL